MIINKISGRETGSASGGEPHNWDDIFFLKDAELRISGKQRTFAKFSQRGCKRIRVRNGIKGLKGGGFQQKLLINPIDKRQREGLDPGIG